MLTGLQRAVFSLEKSARQICPACIWSFRRSQSRRRRRAKPKAHELIAEMTVRAATDNSYWKTVASIERFRLLPYLFNLTDSATWVSRKKIGAVDCH